MVSKVLREELVSVLSDLDSKDESVLEEALSLVRMATKDYKIWKGGLVNTNLTLQPHFPALNLNLQKKSYFGTFCGEYLTRQTHKKECTDPTKIVG